MKKSVLIYGAGSLGTFLGVLLANKGHSVTLYGRRKLKNLHDTILINGEVYSTPERVYSLPIGVDYDCIFVTTKLYDSRTALEEINAHGIRYKNIVLIQNGLVDEGQFSDFKSHAGFVSISVFEGYQLIDNQLIATKSSLGWQIENNEAGQVISHMLEEAGIHCSLVDNIDSIRAEKMILVNAVGALSALEGKTLGELVVGPKTRQIVEDLIGESYSVLVTDHSLPPLAEVKRRFYETISQVSRHYSSVYQDVVSSRPTEIEFLNGFIVQLGKKKGIPTPVNERIYKKLCRFE